MKRISLVLVFLPFLILPASAQSVSTPDVNRAQSTCEKALTLDPHDRESLFTLALIYEKKRQTQAALDAWKRYIAEETDPAKRAIGEKHIHHLSQ